MQKQPNSSYCFVCGLENVASVRVRFYETVSDDGDSEVMALFSGQPYHQGYPGRMHGGVLTGVLDETIASAINFGEGVHVERWGITAELNTRFLHPVSKRRSAPGAAFSPEIDACSPAAARSICPTAPSRFARKANSSYSRSAPFPGRMLNCRVGVSTRMRSEEC